MFGGSEQARTCRGGEGDGALQLGVIISARAVQRIGPAMVKYIFAAAVRFTVKRRRADGFVMLVF